MEGFAIRKPLLPSRSIPALALTGMMLCITCYLLFAHLGAVMIMDYDESRHGINAYEMIRNQDYVVSTFQGETDYWNLKPPLSFWFIAIGYKLFGYNALGLRFFSALATLLVSAALALWAYRRQGRWTAPLIVLLYMANSMVFGVHFARFGDADAQYQLFFTLSMLCMLNTDRDFRWFYGSGVFFGLAFMEKGLHAINIPLICLAVLLLTGRAKQLSWKRVGLLLLSGTAPILPWAVARISRDGLTFFRNMISTDVVSRIGLVAEPETVNMPSLWYYLMLFWNNKALLVCVLLCVLSVMVLLARRTRLTAAQRNAVTGCAVWAFLPIAFYTITDVKFSWYVYSLLAAVPALTVVLVSIVMQDAPFRRLFTVALCLAIACSAIFTAQNVQTVSSYRFRHVIQGCLQVYLNRDTDQGRHTYIQYYETDRLDWMPADMLTALLYGDVVCKDGGLDAFLADEEGGLLFVVRYNNGDAIDTLRKTMSVRGENEYIVVFDSRPNAAALETSAATNHGAESITEPDHTAT